jgi:DNA invertase Pin-like site-specific DNA recombinase
VKIDRFARSLQELIINIEEIINNGGRFVAIENGLDFDKLHYNGSNALMLHIFGAFAQFEREMIRERTLEGLARVKAQGKKLGRPRKEDIEVLHNIRMEKNTPPQNLNENQDKKDNIN